MELLYQYSIADLSLLPQKTGEPHFTPTFFSKSPKHEVESSDPSQRSQWRSSRLLESVSESCWHWRRGAKCCGCFQDIEKRADSFTIEPTNTAVQPSFTFLWSSPLCASGSLQEWEIKGDQQPQDYLTSHLSSSKDLDHQLCKVFNSYIKFHFNFLTAILH